MKSMKSEGEGRNQGSFQMISSVNVIYQYSNRKLGGGAQGLAPGNFLRSHSLGRRRMAIVRSD